MLFRSAHQLVEDGKAFYCFATSEELDQMREEQMAEGLRPKYDVMVVSYAQQ